MPAPISEEQMSRNRDALLDAAQALFYERGIQAVGMDAIRDAAGIPLKRIYVLFPTKEDLVVAVLQRRDRRWRASLAEYVERREDPCERVLSVFDWLERWFAEPGFRGCAWINAFGELGSASPAILAEVRAHKQAFHDQIAAWVEAASDAPAGPVCLMAEGAIVTASITGDTKAARAGQAAVKVLLG
ncbi:MULTISPECIES: TetR/AcrR family transcriptional regulator [unclassified Streptomyces]|uniref:TetR/AcrR family transcriptional regulator n=1 Tax=unclassified Streptomyces TaxID=2593676 RepID=UPI002E1F7F59|nr:TetR/AcrR family transcriptional regulator [Streptomyces sp. NBC_01023]